MRGENGWGIGGVGQLAGFRQSWGTANDRQKRDLILGLTPPSSGLPFIGGRLTGGLLISIGTHRSAQWMPPGCAPGLALTHQLLGLKQRSRARLAMLARIHPLKGSLLLSSKSFTSWLLSQGTFIWSFFPSFLFLFFLLFLSAFSNHSIMKIDY